MAQPEKEKKEFLFEFLGPLGSKKSPDGDPVFSSSSGQTPGAAASCPVFQVAVNCPSARGLGLKPAWKKQGCNKYSANEWTNGRGTKPRHTTAMLSPEILAQDLAGAGRGHQLVGVGRAEDHRDLGRSFLYWNPQITSRGQLMGRHKFRVQESLLTFLS